MKAYIHTFFTTLIALSLLILPMQNAWSMAKMSNCDTSVMGEDHTNSMENMTGCSHHSQENVDNSSDDCLNDSCQNCVHLSNIVPLLIDLNQLNVNQRSFNASLPPYLVSFLYFPDSPPPKHS